MPVYDYQCKSCGPFSAMRPMSEYDKPQPCPECGTAAPRAFLRMPAIAGMDAGQRHAHATNERSAHDPKRSSKGEHVHGPGCGCGSSSSKKKSRTVYGPDGSKYFPTSRPWQISH